MDVKEEGSRRPFVRCGVEAIPVAMVFWIVRRHDDGPGTVIGLDIADQGQFSKVGPVIGVANPATQQWMRKKQIGHHARPRRASATAPLARGWV